MTLRGWSEGGGGGGLVTSKNLKLSNCAKDWCRDRILCIDYENRGFQLLRRGGARVGL